MILRYHPQFVSRISWTEEELETDLRTAMDRFRRARLEEPLEEYLNHFEDAQDTVDELIETTVDLTALEEQALLILSDPKLLDGFRYLAGPPISKDDLKTLVDTNSLSPKTLQNNPDLVERLVATIREGLDRRRFPWVAENREPSPSERQAAVLATAALLATRRTETARRSLGKSEQEEQVRQALLGNGFVEVTIQGGAIPTVADAPRPGTFCMDILFGDRKAYMVVGLWDLRIMPIECKVSNSSTNSVKRLNNDAAVKAVAWIKAFGERHVVPVATLSGVYKLHNLWQAQEQGLSLVWAHRLDDLIKWIERTRVT
jgi:hypothetical protein